MGCCENWSIFNNGTAIIRNGYIVAVIDLILANIAIVIGFTYNYTPVHNLIDNGIGWNTLILQTLQLPFQFFVPIRITENFIIAFSFATFLVESSLSILLFHGIRKLDEKRLKVWFRIRLLFFLLTFISLVIRTINLRHVEDPYIVLEQGSIGILYMTYRGYGLIVITFLEELAYKSISGRTYQLV